MKKITHRTILDNGQTFEKIAFNRRKNNTEPATFEEVFGDLSGYIFGGDISVVMDLSNLNLSSLKGFPTEIEADSLKINDNPNLRSLEYFPKIIKSITFGSVDIYIDIHMIALLKERFLSNVIIMICCEKIKDIPLVDIATSFQDLRVINGDFESFLGFLTGDSRNIDYVALEKINDLYLKLNMNEEHLRRTLTLI